MPDFESDLLSVLGAAEDCGVDRPDALSSVVLSRRIGAGLSLCCVASGAAGFSAAFGRLFVADAAAGGGAYFAVLRYIVVSINGSCTLEIESGYTLTYGLWMDPYVLQFSMGSPSACSVTTS